LRTSVRQLLFLVVLIRLRSGRKALVRTLHNLEPHDPGGAVERWLLGICDRWTTLWIRLNDAGPVPTDAPSVLIPHGHYRDWFAAFPTPPLEPGRLLYFGRLRSYKGVAELLRAFAGIDDDGLRLRLVGRPDGPEVAALIADAERTDRRISAELRHVSDREAAAELGRAELVVLPYRQMHNSGAALLALSLGRAVLVPGNPVTSALADEVGPGWVIRYEGQFDVAALQAAINAVRAAAPTDPPDLSAREWDHGGRAHVAAFEQARQLARSRRRGRSGTLRRSP
jgi:beta-1,4-mannosyltransferase